MKMRKHLIITLLQIYCFQTICCVELTLVNTVIDKLSSDLQLSRATIITSDTKKLSSISLNVLKRLKNQIPLRIFTKIIASKKMIRRDKKLKKAQKSLAGIPESRVFKILLIDIKLENKTKITTEINKYIRFLRTSSRHHIRPYCLIIFVSKIPNTYVMLFESMWKHKYLYVTIIEIVKQKTIVFYKKPKHKSRTLRTKISKKGNSIVKTKIYVYNPFIKKINHNLNINELFSDKLSNFHRYNIAVGFFKEQWRKKVHVNGHSKVSANLIGSLPEVIFVQYFADHFNASILNLGHYTEAESRIILGYNKIDVFAYFTQLPGALGFCNIITPKHNTWRRTLIMKQFGYNEKLNLWPLFIYLSLIIIVISILTVLRNYLRFDKKIWSIYNIGMMLIGYTTIRLNNKSLKEKITLLVLIIMSVTYISELIQSVVNTTFSNKKYYDLSTFKGITISPYDFETTTETYKYLRRRQSTYNMQIIVQKIKKTQNLDSVLDCIPFMFNSSMNLCLIHEVFAKMFESVYDLHIKNGSTLSILLEILPMNNQLASIRLSKCSPYLETINFLFMRASQFGLINYWENMYMYYTFALENNYLDNVQNILEKKEWKNFIIGYFSGKKNNYAQKKVLSSPKINNSLYLVYSIGIFLSFIILLCELIWKKIIACVKSSFK